MWQGTRANTGRAGGLQPAQQAMQLLPRRGRGFQIPFIYLSAGVSNEVFLETLELAAEAGTPFSGVLCGRATWQEGIPEFGKGGSPALREWLKGRRGPQRSGVERGPGERRQTLVEFLWRKGNDRKGACKWLR